MTPRASLQPLHLRRLWLRLTLAVRRLSAGTVFAGLACVAGASVWGILVSHEKTQAALAHAALQGAIATAQRPISPNDPALHATPQARLADFYATLGNAQRAEHPLESLFALANANGLTLARGEYKRGVDTPSRVVSYQSQMPVKGSYMAIRRYCEAVLRTLPYASLDEITFRREGVGNGVLEARLRFTFHLTDTPAARMEREAGPARELDAPGTARIVAMQEVQP